MAATPIEVHSRQCHACGKDFVGRRRHSIFCSNACRQAAYRKRDVGEDAVLAVIRGNRVEVSEDLVERGLLEFDRCEDRRAVEDAILRQVFSILGIRNETYAPFPAVVDFQINPDQIPANWRRLCSMAMPSPPIAIRHRARSFTGSSLNGKRSRLHLMRWPVGRTRQGSSRLRRIQESAADWREIVRQRAMAVLTLRRVNAEASAFRERIRRLARTSPNLVCDVTFGPLFGPPFVGDGAYVFLESCIKAGIVDRKEIENAA